MPKSNLCKHIEDPRLGYMREAVSGGMSRKKISVKEMAKKLGISESSMYKRRDHPETFTIQEFLKIWDILQPDESFEKKVLRKDGRS